MYSFYSTLDQETGSTPGSLLHPTPIYYQEQHVSVLEEESDEDFPIRSNSTSMVRRPDNKTLELSVVICHPYSDYETSDWALMLEDRFSGKAFGFRMAGGSSTGKPLKFEFETGSLGSFPTPDRRHILATMPESQCHRVYATARRAQSKFCQRWVIDVIWDLESQGIVPPGKANDLSKLVEEDLYPEEQISYNDLLSMFEQERERPIHRQVTAWIRGRPQWGVNTLERFDSRMIQSMLRVDPGLKVPIWAQSRSDRIAVKAVALRMMWFRWRQGLI